MEFILGLLGPILPYIVGAVAVVGGYFFIKSKGASEERQKNEIAVAKEREKLQGKVDSARSKDEEVDVKVNEKVSSLKKKPKEEKTDWKAGDQFRF